jgi:hypothetical protein
VVPNQFIGGQFDPDAENSNYGESAGVTAGRKDKEISDIRCTEAVTVAIEPLKFLTKKQR